MAEIGNEKIETRHILSWHANLPYILTVTLNVVLCMKVNNINMRKNNMAAKTAEQDSNQ